MDLNDYQAGAATTAVYPGPGEFLGLSYTVMGLCGGAGAVANQAKKCIRDDGLEITSDRREKIKNHAGETLWYLAQVLTELGISLEDVGEFNLAQLADRYSRGVIQGDGDER